MDGHESTDPGGVVELAAPPTDVHPASTTARSTGGGLAGIWDRRRWTILLLAGVLILAGIGGIVALHAITASKPAGTLNINEPDGIAVAPSGDIYISESIQTRVLKLASNGVILASSFGKAGSLGITTPGALATDRHGNLYDDEGTLILKYAPNGRPLGNVGVGNGGSGIGDPGLAVGRTGTIYAVDPDLKHLDVLTPSGSLVHQFGHLWPANGLLENLGGVAIDRQGNIYLLEGGSNRNADAVSRLLKLSPNGRHLATFNRPASVLVMAANGVAVDEKGNVYVAEQGEHRAQLDVLDASLHLQRTIIVPKPPWGVAVATGSDLSVLTKHGVMKVSPSGKQIAVWK